MFPLSKQHRSVGVHKSLNRVLTVHRVIISFLTRDIDFMLLLLVSDKSMSPCGDTTINPKSKSVSIVSFTELACRSMSCNFRLSTLIHAWPDAAQAIERTGELLVCKINFDCLVGIGISCCRGFVWAWIGLPCPATGGLAVSCVTGFLSGTAGFLSGINGFLPATVGFLSGIGGTLTDSVEEDFRVSWSGARIGSLCLFATVVGVGFGLLTNFWLLWEVSVDGSLWLSAPWEAFWTTSFPNSFANDVESIWLEVKDGGITQEIVGRTYFLLSWTSFRRFSMSPFLNRSSQSLMSCLTLSNPSETLLSCSWRTARFDAFASLSCFLLFSSVSSTILWNTLALSSSSFSTPPWLVCSMKSTVACFACTNRSFHSFRILDSKFSNSFCRLVLFSCSTVSSLVNECPLCRDITQSMQVAFQHVWHQYMQSLPSWSLHNGLDMLPGNNFLPYSTTAWCPLLCKCPPLQLEHNIWPQVLQWYSAGLLQRHVTSQLYVAIWKYKVCYIVQFCKICEFVHFRDCA